MSEALKKKIIVAVIITGALVFLYYQSLQREKQMNEFIKMQQAPLKEAEKNQTN